MCVLQDGVSVSPSPVELLHSCPAGLQSQILWGFLLLMVVLQAGELDMELRTLTLVGTLLQYNYFLVHVSPTWQVWDLIMS